MLSALASGRWCPRLVASSVASSEMVRYASKSPARSLATTAASASASSESAADAGRTMSGPDAGSAGGGGGYNFASSGYASSFLDLPKPDPNALRSEALRYMDGFDERSWYDDPVTTILRGEKLLSPPSNVWITKDALARRNGHQYLATEGQVDDIKLHISTYVSPYTDVRDRLRRIEHSLLTEHAGLLIGNQCMDFQKQDGVTEMEESITANTVERRLNDMLLEDEEAGRIVIDRSPVYVSCVSNFTNFLDLFRKTVRSLEVGVPCLVLGRSNTVQHSYRWAELLSDLLRKEDIDPGMLTYLSCTLYDIKDITQTCSERTGNLYATCSRHLAASMKSGYAKTVASTGGPNTLITTRWTPGVVDAIRTSATIECAGQCTALRHAVVPTSVTADDVGEMFDSARGVGSAPEALRGGAFDGIFDGHGGSASPPPGDYAKHGERDAYLRVDTDLPEDDVEEYWRKAVVDVTTCAPASLAEADADDRIASLSRWLVRNQPISLAVNAPRSDSLPLGRALFERTGLVVYTVGSTDAPDAPPAMTCQARPQEAEVFGEFPPRIGMGDYTEFPVIVPSSNPGYGSSYRVEHLRGTSSYSMGEGLDYARNAAGAASDPSTRGYCVVLASYLRDATSANPRRGLGSSRTALWGLQRPPLLDGAVTALRCGADAEYDGLIPPLMPFLITNARSQVEVSVHPANATLLEAMEGAGVGAAVRIAVEDDGEYEGRKRDKPERYYNAVPVGGRMEKFPLAGQFVSLYLPLGHVKSTMADDEEFVDYFAKSNKWLKLHTEE